jgi:hypothetical protein
LIARHHADRVFLEAHVRVADRADHACREVGQAVDVVDDLVFSTS